MNNATWAHRRLPLAPNAKSTLAMIVILILPRPAQSNAETVSKLFLSNAILAEKLHGA